MSLRGFVTESVRPRGLAARAVAFACGLVIVTAALTALALVWGAAHQSGRQQIAIASEITHGFADAVSEGTLTNSADDLSGVMDAAARRPELLRLIVQDGDGRLIASTGDEASGSAVAIRLAAAVRASGVRQVLRFDGMLAIGEPIVSAGGRRSAAVAVWRGDAYRAHVWTSLAPFLLIVVCLLAASIPVTARAVRHAVAPLDELARHAERIGERGEVALIQINTGDEFETLAKAFNKMTARVEASVRHIQQVAFVDPMTRLPNHERFSREVDHFIARSAGERTGAVIVIDLQRLAKLLQTLAPDAARDLLLLVADKVSTSVRVVDKGVRRGGAASVPLPARLGACEFAVFTPDVSADEAIRFALHLNAALCEALEWRGHKFSLAACSGVAMVTNKSREANVIIRQARLSAEAAQTSAARVKAFTAALDREVVSRLTLEREMRAAFEHNEFHAYFQPKISIASGRVEGCEALARWIRPDRTIVSPGRFIPVAEESGLIGTLSDVILREACWKAAGWARAGHPIKVAVNVSALQFRNERFGESILRVVDQAGLAPSLLELEITESMIMEDPERAVRAMQPLRAVGVRFAIDDFGCGHSSLATLSKLPFDVIKIDQQFVRALERGEPQAEAIVETILALGRSLGMEIVAEGIERQEDLTFMAARGCHWAQGFLFGAAIPAQEFGEILRRQGRHAGAVSSDAA
ncbi:MAG: EAL domain-containing protein [Hyphomonadaceae bacterium]|nr:EAL domain-containing protein [Hyphomonadaceae bacterium]